MVSPDAFDVRFSLRRALPLEIRVCTSRSFACRLKAVFDRFQFAIKQAIFICSFQAFASIHGWSQAPSNQGTACLIASKTRASGSAAPVPCASDAGFGSCRMLGQAANRRVEEGPKGMGAANAEAASAGCAGLTRPRAGPGLDLPWQSGADRGADLTPIQRRWLRPSSAAIQPHAGYATPAA